MMSDKKMELNEPEAILMVQEKEKLYSSMKVDQLREMAIEQKIDTKGDKVTLIQRLVDRAAGRKKSPNQIFLEEAIMSWSSTDMKIYLSDLKKPQWGAKAVMTERIMINITIEEAVEITKEYRTFLAATTELTETGESITKVIEADERKRKREGLSNEKGNEIIDGERDGDEITDGEEDGLADMEMDDGEENGKVDEKIADGKEDGEVGGNKAKKKVHKPTRRRENKDDKK